MLIIPDEVVTGALVNAIGVVGRQVSKVAAGLRKTDEDLAAARWFETFRLTGTPPDLPGLSTATGERLAEMLGGDGIQAALQELLAARLTDAPETDASRARDAVRVALSIADTSAVTFAGTLAGYYDDQICALVARLEAEEPPLLAQIRSEAFSARMISILYAIERHTAALADEDRRRPAGRAQAWQQAGDGSAGAQPVQSVRSLSAPPAGRLLAEMTDPFALEVHRPVQSDDPPPGLPVLPAYVPREHDQALAEVVQAAAGGSSGIAVLVGGSSTGKTRACWEALKLLRDLPGPWRLWHPIDPARPQAALRQLPSIGPRTVVWLNEAQFYLDVPDGGVGGQVAAGLRELLRNPDRGPVLVLATLWPQFWKTLTVRPPAGAADPHAQARELLSGRDISVPDAFTQAQVHELRGARDPRLALAAAAPDGQVIQFLAGAPELLAWYRHAPPAARALIHAAMDARRLGMRVGLPQAFLETAAPGYLTDTEWDTLDEDWLEQALVYVAVPCKGVRGPLTRIRARPVRSRAPGPGSRESGKPVGQDQASIADGPLYRLADYLDQYGQYHRKGQFPPAGFWAAAATHAFPGDQATLGDAAHARGLYRDAAQLHKNAAACGDLRAVFYLGNTPHYLHLRADVRPLQWAVTYVSLDDPAAVARLLDRLREAAAEGQVTALLHRDPAAHVPLDDPVAVAGLLDSLREAGAEDQVTALASRAAAHVSLDDPAAVAWLLDRLREAGAEGQVTALADRAAAHVPLHNPYAVASLLDRLREAGAEGQIIALLHRDPAAHVSLHNPDAVAWLLDRLREAGAEGQVTALADRAATHVPLDDPDAVIWLLDRLREAGAEGQVTALADRAATHVPLDDPWAIASLLTRLREAGAEGQVHALADRLPGEGMFELFRVQEGRQDRFLFGREADGRPAEPWGWEDLD